MSAAARRLWRPDPYLLLLLGLSLFALTPLLSPGYFYDAHDGRHSVFYQLMFDASLRDGALWPRWAMHHLQGYGYPTFIIQAPLGFYLAELFVLLGAGYTLAAKFAWATGFLVGAAGMYWLALQWIGARVPGRSPCPPQRLAAVVAGLLYVYAPYHLLTIYVRAALNDSLLFAWYPFVFLTFDALIHQGRAPRWQSRLALAALALAGVLLTHTFALLSLLPLLVSFVLFRLFVAWRIQREPRALGWRAGLAFAAGCLGLLLCAVFLIPLLVEGPNLQSRVFVSNTYDFRNHFVQLGQFLSPFWGFGYSDDPGGANDGMGFQLGLMPVLFLTFAIAILVLHREPNRLRRSYMGYLSLATIAILFLMTPAAAFIWERFPLLGIIQFPWRLLALTSFTLAGLGGLAAANLLETLGDLQPDFPASPEVTGSALMMSLLVVLASYSYVQASTQPIEPWREDGRAIFRFEEEHPDMIALTRFAKEQFTDSPLGDAYRDPNYAEVYGEAAPWPRLAILAGTGEVLSQYSRGSSGGGVVDMQTPGVVRLNLMYFPGWHITIDRVPVAGRVSDPHGLIEVDVPAGEHHIEARMGTTPDRMVGTAISWVTLLVVVTLAWWPRRWPIRSDQSQS